MEEPSRSLEGGRGVIGLAYLRSCSASARQFREFLTSSGARDILRCNARATDCGDVPALPLELVLGRRTPARRAVARLPVRHSPPPGSPPPLPARRGAR